MYFKHNLSFVTGEALKVKIDILNNSSRPVTPKYYLYMKQSFFARMNCNLMNCNFRRRKVATGNILKEKGEVVNARSGENVTRLMSIPAELLPSIFNCPILKLEYRLKVMMVIPKVAV